ncbi:unnamed protein product [Mucor hiemalis]
MAIGSDDVDVTAKDMRNMKLPDSQAQKNALCQSMSNIVQNIMEKNLSLNPSQASFDLILFYAKYLRNPGEGPNNVSLKCLLEEDDDLDFEELKIDEIKYAYSGWGAYCRSFHSGNDPPLSAEYSLIAFRRHEGEKPARYFHTPGVNEPDKTTVYGSELNVDLARLLLEYYVLDIWSCLGTTSKYLKIEGISVRDFSSRNAILNRAKYNKKNGGTTIKFVNMEHQTVRRYFEAIFPNDSTNITEAAKDITDSRVMYGIHRVHVRTAYILAMKNRMYMQEYEDIQHFHDSILYPEFLRRFRVMQRRTTSRCILNPAFPELVVTKETFNRSMRTIIRLQETDDIDIVANMMVGIEKNCQYNGSKMTQYFRDGLVLGAAIADYSEARFINSKNK